MESVSIGFPRFVENRPDGSIWSRGVDVRDQRIHFTTNSQVAKESRSAPEPPPAQRAVRKSK